MSFKRVVTVALAASLGTSVMCIGVAQASPGQSVTSISGGATAVGLAQSLAGAGVVISNVTYTGDPHAAGEFSGMSAAGIDSGVALSSGAVATEATYTSSLLGPNTSDSTSGSFGLPGDTDLNTLIAPDVTYDAAVLEFDFTSTLPQISFDYVFGSDEYNEFVNQYNDVFAFYVNGVNCATVGTPPTPVSIDTINTSSNPSLYRNNDPSDLVPPPIDTELDGLSTVLTCAASVNPAATNHLKLAIADTRDGSLDAAVLIKSGSLQANDPPTAVNDSYSVSQGTVLTVTAPGVLANDTDPQSDSLTSSLSSGRQAEPSRSAGMGASPTHRTPASVVPTPSRTWQTTVPQIPMWPP